MSMPEATTAPEIRDDEPAEQSNGPAILVIAGLGDSGKVERHLGPLAAVAGETTVVCTRAGPDVDGLTYRSAPTPEMPLIGSRYIGIAAMLVVAVSEAVRGDYDAVASISLIPYGCFALVVGALTRIPTHLGIIGADLDCHATAWYGFLVRSAFRRFTAVSVPGTDHRRRLVRMGVSPNRVSILANAVNTDRYRPTARLERFDRDDSTEYDFLWVGRFSPEKDPVLFVRALDELTDRGLTFEATMVGSGPLEPTIRRERAVRGLVDQLDLPGWVEDPLPYYVCSSAFVLTSKREGLPLSLLEAMAVGVAPIVPNVGSVTDVAVDGETAVVIAERTPEVLADSMERLLTDRAFRERLTTEAPAVRGSYSYAKARDDWRHILVTMGCLERRPSRIRTKNQ